MLHVLTSLQHVALAAKLLEIGKSFLKTLREGPHSPDGVQQHPSQYAVKWMQKAFTIIELSDDSTVAGLGELKVALFFSPVPYVAV